MLFRTYDETWKVFAKKKPLPGKKHRIVTISRPVRNHPVRNSM